MDPVARRRDVSWYSSFFFLLFAYPHPRGVRSPNNFFCDPGCEIISGASPSNDNPMKFLLVILGVVIVLMAFLAMYKAMRWTKVMVETMDQNMADLSTRLEDMDGRVQAVEVGAANLKAVETSWDVIEAGGDDGAAQDSPVCNLEDILGSDRDSIATQESMPDLICNDQPGCVEEPCLQSMEEPAPEATTPTTTPTTTELDAGGAGAVDENTSGPQELEAAPPATTSRGRRRTRN